MKFIFFCLVLLSSACSQPPVAKPPAWEQDYPAGFFASAATSKSDEIRPTPPEATIQISVQGTVKNPGAYTLAAGANLIDAIVAAGGARGGGIIGGLYMFHIRRASGSTYSFNAQNGAARLRGFILQNGDVIFAGE